MYNLAVDAMGLDKGSEVVVKACLSFVKDYSVTLHVFGNQDQLSSLNNHPRIVVHHTTQVMDMSDGALAVRRKKDASIVRAVESVCDRKCDGVVSAGSTGALLASSTLLMKNIPGINRGALMVTMPSKKGPLVLLDVGASSENSSEDLVNFAFMGQIYAKAMYHIQNPRVGLLNIGAEPKKGDTLRKETYAKLEELNHSDSESSSHSLRFVGNIEGRELLEGDVDVVVCDGYSGNIALKTIEGAASFMTSLLKEQLMSSTISKIGALLAKKALHNMKQKVDYKQYGGGLCIGVNYPVVKAHGSSDETAFYHAMRQLYLMIDADVVGKIRKEYEQ